MDEAEEEEKDIEAVDSPEVVVSLPSNLGMGEDEDDTDDSEEEDASDASDSSEYPEGEGGFVVGVEVHFLDKTLQVIQGLGGDMVEVDTVTNGVDKGEEEGSHGDNFVELDMGVQWDVLMKGDFPDLGDQIPTHGEKEERVAEGERSSRSSSDSYPISHDMSQISVFREKAVAEESFEEEDDHNHVEDEEIHDGLSVLFQVCDPRVPLRHQPVWSLLWLMVDLERGHSRRYIVRTCIKEVLIRSLKVQPNSDQFPSFLIIHHLLEILVCQLFLLFQVSRSEHPVNHLHGRFFIHRIGLGYVDQGSEDAHQFLLVNDPISIIVTHVKYHSESLLCLSLGETVDCFQEFLERDPSILVLVNTVEHLLDEEGIWLHPQCFSELVLRQ